MIQTREANLAICTGILITNHFPVWLIEKGLLNIFYFHSVHISTRNFKQLFLFFFNIERPLTILNYSEPFLKKKKDDNFNY